MALQPYMGKSTTTGQIAGAAGTTTLLVSAGRLGQVVVLSTGTGTGLVSIFDNATTASGNIVGVISATATAGTVITFDMPVAHGITVQNVASGPALAVAFH
jgi:hypothetical protein